MCGIAGYIGDEGNESQILRMTEILKHRGPDGQGNVQLSLGARKAYLGHRRLKIIDLSTAGQQPMFNADRTLSISFNGEIYNYIELRNELKTAGYTFRSNSDTEVVLAAYEKWGTNCFKRLNGMWAIAILDEKENRLILSRDRFGKKPLYYFKTSNEFYFASEIKSLLVSSRVPRKPNLEKVHRYLCGHYRYVDNDSTSFFDGIEQIPKASYSIIDSDLQMKAEKFWELTGAPVTGSESDLVGQFRELLVDSVRIRLRSDVPVASMLSGGLDSTSITAIAHKILKNPIQTFSGVTGTVKGIYDESEYIDAVVREIDSNHQYIRPDPQGLSETIDEMLRFHDEPVCTVTWYTLYLIAKKVREHKIPVVLNGHGGDELIAGYWDHYHYFFSDLEKTGKDALAQKEIEAWKRNHQRPNSIGELDSYRNYIAKLDRGEVVERSLYADYSQCFVTSFSKPGPQPKWFPDLLSNRMAAELMLETVPAVLRAEDRNTMANSIESRSPFLDYRLVEFCFGLPNHMKIRDGVGKWILRESMKGILPEVVRTRKDKTGFLAPADEWFRGVEKPRLSALIDSLEAGRRPFIKSKEVKRTFEEHQAGTKNHAMFLWQFMNFELWMRRFFD